MSALPRTNPFVAEAASQAAEPGNAQDLAIELARLQKMLRATPNDIDTLLRAGGLMQHAGRLAEASKLLTRAAVLASDRPETTVTLVEFLRARAMHDEALALLRQAIDKSPEAPALWRAMARMVLDFADVDNACAFFDEALHLDPNYHRCRLERAALHHRTGRLAEALADYESLRQAAPNDPGVLLGWGDVKTAMGERAEARVAYTAALEFVRNSAPIVDRLQRLATMEYSRPLPRADLSPAQTSAGAARPDRVDIVFFHVDLPDMLASPFDKPDYQAMLAQAAAIARRQAPNARIVLLTDERTRFPAGLQVDRIVRGPVDGAQLMFDRMRLERDFRASGEAAAGVVFLDSDVVVNRDPREIFDGSFDVALTWRDDILDIPFNGGVALYRTGPAAVRFYDHLIATHVALEKHPAVVARFTEGMRCWWGHQLAMAATVGWTEFARRRSDRLSVDGTAVRFLPADDYNFAMDPALPTPRGLDRRSFIHFKASRRGEISRRQKVVLAPPDAYTPAVAGSGRGATESRPAPRELHFCLANHSAMGQKTLTDLFDCMSAGFDELGFKITTSTSELRSDVPNIIFEHRNVIFKPFLDRNRGKSKVICVVTEILKADKFDDASGSWNGTSRFQDFLSIADHYAGIITTIPSNVDLLRTIAPTTFFEFGYSDRLLTLSDWRSWKYDYSCSGAMTQHRRKFLTDVASQITVKTPGDPRAHTAELISTEDYINLIRHTAVNICLKQHPTWEYPSGTRLARILHSGVGCATEATEIKISLSRYVPTFKDSDDFLRRFAHVDRQKIAAEALDRLSLYRAELPMKREAERNIAECPPLVV